MHGRLNRAVASPDPFDLKPQPLTIRTLKNYKRPATDVVTRVRGEFIEMRGFSPTVEQAARLFDLPREDCDTVLAGLVQQGFLHRTADGRYRLSPQR
jgi:hypothetical protein